MTKFKPLACGFHSHTDIGSLDGASTPDAKIIRASKLGRVADCVTDHGTMNALANHWFAAQKLYKDKKIEQKIQSIHGIEAYVRDFIRGPKIFKNGKQEDQYFHLTIHFKTQAAYQYFTSLTPAMEKRSVKRYDENKPILLLEELEPIAGQITLGSGCLVGMVQKNINDWKMTADQRVDVAKHCYERLRNLAGPGNFFVEVFPHKVDTNWRRPVYDKKNKKKLETPGAFIPILEESHICGPHCAGLTHIKDECGHDTLPRDLQLAANQFVIEMARKYGDPIIISEDSHFATKEDKLVQEVRLGNGTERWKFSNSYHMGDSDEWAKNLKEQLGVSDRDVEEWIDNSYKFVESFKEYKFDTAKERILLPTIDMVYETKSTTKEKLQELIDEYGLMPKSDHPQYQVYKDRIAYEVSVLADNGVADFLPYFFVLEDCCRYARANSITYNTRGSAGGSLIAYLIRISITDPIKYDLPFERFLTLGRIKSGSLPDIDTDWQDRDQIVAYLMKKYGNKAALISTNLLLRLKSSIKDVEHSMLGFVRPETEVMTKSITGAPQGVSDKDWLFGYTDKTTGEYTKGFLEEETDEAHALKKYSKDYPEIWDTAMRCIGITKSKGVHAGGIIITPGPVESYFPLITTNKGMATAFDMKGVENCGGVKYDFLGLDTLFAIGTSMRSVSKRFGKLNEWIEFPHDDAVYTDIIEKDLLAAIFQLNTDTTRPWLRRTKPRTIAEIAIHTSLIRPGALEAPSPDPHDPYDPTKPVRADKDDNISAAKYFVLCREGKRKPYYIHPELEHILGDTYGVLVYQEQTLRLFRDLAGYSYEDAEEVRRGIGKKIKELLNKHSAVLKQKCLERGWTEDQAERLFKSIEASARYSFNKSHATSYALVAYAGCYIKRYFPLDFWMGELTTHAQDHDKLRVRLNEWGQRPLPIDILKSHPYEWSIEGDKLRPPLSIIKKCGAKSVENLHNFIKLPLDEFAKLGIVADTDLSEEAQEIINAINAEGAMAGDDGSGYENAVE